jgi:ribosomal protein S18 acetylase RimI-like enzyme
MTTATTDLDELLRSLAPELNPGDYVFATLPSGATVDAAHVVASIREPEGVSVVLAQDVARRAGLTPLFVCAWITLKVHSDLQAVGLTAAFSEALGRAGISCNVVAGACHDHIFVPQHLAQAALQALTGLQQSARNIAPRQEASLSGGVGVAVLVSADAARYRALMLEAYAQAPDAFTSTPQEREAEPESWWVRRIADPAGASVVFGACQGQALVGAVALEFSAKPKTRHKAHLIGMYVQPGARGSGAGKLLLAAAMAHLRTRCPDITVVVLTVTEGNTSAIRLYQSSGFAAFGTEPMAIRTPDGYKAKVHMACRVGAAGDTMSGTGGMGGSAKMATSP